MKRYLLLICIVLLLLTLYGATYLQTIRLEKLKETFAAQISVLQSKNEDLKVKLLDKSSPLEIDKLARTKYEMKEPDSFYIIEIDADGK
jgi:cell division protein FtsL